MTLPHRAPTAHDIETLARTAYGEDRGDGLRGMIAVCWVACNRAAIAERSGRKQFGDGSIAAACLAPEQFDCWMTGKPFLANRKAMLEATLDDHDYQLATLAALMVVSGQATDCTQGADGYWADSIPTPAWAEGKAYVSIGHQKYAAGI